MEKNCFPTIEFTCPCVADPRTADLTKRIFSLRTKTERRTREATRNIYPQKNFDKSLMLIWSDWIWMVFPLGFDCAGISNKLWKLLVSQSPPQNETSEAFILYWSSVVFSCNCATNAAIDENRSSSQPSSCPPTHCLLYARHTHPHPHPHYCTVLYHCILNVIF